jgi:hypothetical protein
MAVDLGKENAIGKGQGDRPRKQTIYETISFELFGEVGCFLHASRFPGHCRATKHSSQHSLIKSNGGRCQGDRRYQS